MPVMPSRPKLNAGLLTQISGPSDRRIWGMPVPVWTMLLWLLASVVMGILSRLIPVVDIIVSWPRQLWTVNALVGIAVMLWLRARTPAWFLHLEVILSGLMVTALVGTAMNAASAITSMLILMVVAAYVAYWLPGRIALAYVGVSTIAVLAALLANPDSGRPVAAWLLISGLGLAQVLVLGTLIGDLKRQAVTDPLTGLLNRAGLDLLASSQQSSGRLTHPRSLVVMDLDGFKGVNDRLGHIAGDAVLREFGEMVMAVSRPDDILVRSGGDEFVMVLPGTDVDGADDLGNRLRASTSVGFSFGVASWRAGEDYYVAMARADQQMYEVKHRRKPDLGAAG